MLKLSILFPIKTIALSITLWVPKINWKSSWGTLTCSKKCIYKNLYLNQFQGYLEDGILFILTDSEATKGSTVWQLHFGALTSQYFQEWTIKGLKMKILWAWTIFYAVVLFIFQIFLFKRKKYQLYAKWVTHIWFLTTENVYNWPIYSWSRINISKSLGLNNRGPKEKFVKNQKKSIFPHFLTCHCQRLLNILLIDLPISL